MALNNIGMGMTITATNLASGTLRRVSRDVAGTAGVAKAASMEMRAGFGVAAVGALGLVAGIVALRGAVGLANAAGEFTQSIAAVGAVAKASADELALLRQTAIDAGIATQFSPTEAVEGLQSLITAGQTARQATETLVPVLDLAAGSLGQLGVAGAAEAVVGTLNSYQIAADEAGGVTDRLLRITQLTNFQARDFAGGLAKAASAGAVFNQDLNDVLITMGLLRNANIDASSSSTAFRESVRRLGSDQRAQAAITGQNVDIFDEQTGAMRSVVDIMQDLTDATADMGDEERNRIAAQAFGARGLLAFNSVAQATFTTMQDGTEVVLRGRDAIEAMRLEMSSAEGTAADMRDQLLDTFAGQKQLLSGTLSTLGIVLGESFERIFKPIVANIVDFLNMILRFFNELPDATKDLITKFFLFAGATLVLTGAITLFTGIARVLRVTMGKLRLTMIAMSTTMLPLIAIFGSLIAVIGIFTYAASRDVGGFGEFVAKTWDKIKLAFNGLVQAFTTGRFSGAVLEELNRVENSGIKQFVITVYGLAQRVGQFFKGIGEAISDGFDEMAPMFAELRTSMGRVSEAFGGTGDAIRDSSGSFKDWMARGRAIGEFFMPLFRGIVAIVTVMTDIFAGMVKSWGEAMEEYAPWFDYMKSGFGELKSALNEFSGDTSMEEGGEAALSLGEFIGGTFGGIAALIGGAIGVIMRFAAVITRVVRVVWDGLRIMWGAFERIGMTVRDVFLDVVDTIRNAISRVVEFFGDAAEMIPEEFRGETLNGMVASGRNAEQNRIRRDLASDQRNLDLERDMQISMEEQAIIMGAERPQQAPPKPPTAAELVAALRQAPFIFQMDGETIARATAAGARSDQARGFGSAPAETGS